MEQRRNHHKHKFFIFLFTNEFADDKIYLNLRGKRRRRRGELLRKTSDPGGDRDSTVEMTC